MRPTHLKNIIKHGIWVSAVFLLGCNTPTAEQAATTAKPSPKAVSNDHKRPQRDKRRGRESSKEAKKKRGKGRLDRALMRKWARQNLYMRLTLEKLSITEEQLAKLSDMNWKHFKEETTHKTQRPKLDQSVLNMLTTGKFDPAPFEQETTWSAAYERLLHTQYTTRMSTLHNVLDDAQRKQLVELVEKEQKKQYAFDEKVKAATSLRLPPGCGKRAYRLFSRFIDVRQLTRKQRGTLSTLQSNFDQDRPTPEQVADIRQAQRIYDAAVRKSFVKPTFDAAKLTRPSLPTSAPAAFGPCRTKALKAYFDLLTPENRKAAQDRITRFIARHHSASVPAGRPDAGRQ